MRLSDNRLAQIAEFDHGSMREHESMAREILAQREVERAARDVVEEVDEHGHCANGQMTLNLRDALAALDKATK